ncbi:site-specific integrase [Entomomonas asaccharolytica]|nr:site-specific integrase [Entomomonas asaccharolytica]
MGKFANADKQAGSVMKQLQGSIVRSIGSVRNYEGALKQVAQYCIDSRISLRQLTPAMALVYLEQRAEDVGQKTLDMERQAIQLMMQQVSHLLEPDKRLPVIKSEYTQVLNSRAYSQAQVELIVEAQSPANAMATELAYSSGLRAHELFTLLPATERIADTRPALASKFVGREGVLYTVQGKGGLIREVVIPYHLANRLEELRLAEPITITDRHIHYQQHYGINGGNRWSSSFSTASKRALGWSNGAHGLRHSYAKRRMVELQVHCGLNREQALQTVSQEMGHFRPSITEVYLR